MNLALEKVSAVRQNQIAEALNNAIGVIGRNDVRSKLNKIRQDLSPNKEYRRANNLNPIAKEVLSHLVKLLSTSHYKFLKNTIPVTHSSALTPDNDLRNNNFSGRDTPELLTDSKTSIEANLKPQKPTTRLQQLYNSLPESDQLMLIKLDAHLLSTNNQNNPTGDPEIENSRGTSMLFKLATLEDVNSPTLRDLVKRTWGVKENNFTEEELALPIKLKPGQVPFPDPFSLK